MARAFLISLVVAALFVISAQLAFCEGAVITMLIPLAAPLVSALAGTPDPTL